MDNRFNSFTQQICLDNAVVGITSQEDSQPLKPADYVGKNEDGSPVPVISATDKTSAATIMAELDTATTQYPSQIVSYSSKFVEKISDVTSDMNISGSLSITYGEISGGGGGSYVNTQAFHNSDLNFLIQVTVLNQTVNVKDQLQFWPLNNSSPNSYVQNPESFTKTYGDTFISGFQEGGTFSAVVSIKAMENSNKTDIAANAHLALSVGAAAIKADADVKIANENLAKNSEITITINWSGGGQLKESTDLWTIETLQAVAAKFPDLVAACPQRTHAVLTKYESLRTYLNWKGGLDISPLNYEIAALYTSELLDAYMGYKSIWTEIHKNMQDLDAGVIELIKAPPPQSVVHRPSVLASDNDRLDTFGLTADKWKEGEVIPTFEPTFADLDKALQTCRSLMIRIVLENEYVTKNPKLAIDKDRPVAYLRPQVFRQLLPIQPPAPSLTVDLKVWNIEFGQTPGNGAQVVWTYDKKPNILPTIVQGFTKIDYGRVTGTRFNLISNSDSQTFTGFRLLTNAPVQSTRYGTGVAALEIPINDDGILGGEVLVKNPAPATAPSVPPANALVRTKVKFAYEYEEGPPRVVVWLSTFDMDQIGPLNISVKTDHVTRDDFEIVVRGINSWTSASVCWMAVPQDMKGVVMGSTETPWAPGLMENAPDKSLPILPSMQDHVRFPVKSFVQAPTIVAFISGFAFTSDIFNSRVNTEVLDVTKRGFNWKLSPWSDTKLTGASLSWIAFGK